MPTIITIVLIVATASVVATALRLVGDRVAAERRLEPPRSMQSVSAGTEGIIRSGDSSGDRR